MTQDNSSGSTPAADASEGTLFNTAAGWVLFAGVVALGLSVLSDKYFHGYDPEELEAEKMGYLIEAPEDDAGADAGPSLAVLLASATPEAGEKVFAKCQACHQIAQGGANGVGPGLYGVMGKGIGANAPGFGYSSALSGKGGEWTWENMDAWLASPRGFIEGTSMSFAGLSKPEDRANLMVYLAANGGAPPMPEPEAEAPAEGEEVAESEEAEANAEEEATAEAEQNVAEETSEETAEAESD
ncbi:MAG: cytochrome c family protein [Pseudomonadota bacterium]